MLERLRKEERSPLKKHAFGKVKKKKERTQLKKLYVDKVSNKKKGLHLRTRRKESTLETRCWKGYEQEARSI